MDKDKIAKTIIEMQEETKKAEIRDLLEELELVENQVAYHDAKKLEYMFRQSDILDKLHERGVKTI